MKKLLLFLVAVALVAACAKVEKTEDVSQLNDWETFKNGSVSKKLKAGQHIEVGTVSFDLNNENFTVTYSTIDGWAISETHMSFASKVENLPLNGPGKPKIGKFEYKDTHDMVTSVIYTVPRSDFPDDFADPYQITELVAAAHAVVNKTGEGSETAWAEGLNFTDKGWSMYCVLLELLDNDNDNSSTILYGTRLAADSLYLYHMNMTSGENTLVFSEAVGGGNGTYDGTAFDEEEDVLLFANYNSNELMISHLSEDTPSTSTGTLSGVSGSATFYDGSYYYVDESLNTLNEVTFTSDWQIDTETTISTIPGSVDITDIAMDPTGSTIYMVGNVNDGSTEMISYDVAENSYATINLSVGQDTQIAYSADGNLYAVTSADELGDGFATYTIDTDTGIASAINTNQTEIEDPISDISRGPIM